MRRRVATLINASLDGNDKSVAVGSYLESELGIQIVSTAGYSAFVRWENFLTNCELRDFVDVITLVYRFAILKRWLGDPQGYRNTISRIFRERNMGYRIDGQCGVHPHVDSAFEQSRISAIIGLETDRYNAAREHIESAEHSLMENAPNNRQAIRSIFDAAENIFKMMFNGVTQTNGATIRDNLRPQIETVYAGNLLVKRTSLKQCDGFRDWVDSAHFYRHADGEREPAQPPKELTVLIVSQGYGWVRWLAALDKEMLVEAGVD